MSNMVNVSYNTSCFIAVKLSIMSSVSNAIFCLVIIFENEVFIGFETDNAMVIGL